MKDVEAAVAYLTGLGYRGRAERIYDPLQNVNLGMFTHAEMPDVEIIYPAEGRGPARRTPVDPQGRARLSHMLHVRRPRRSLEAMEIEVSLRLFEVSSPKPAVLFGGKPVSFYVVGGVGLIEIIDEGRGRAT